MTKAQEENLNNGAAVEVKNVDAGFKLKLAFEARHPETTLNVRHCTDTTPRQIKVVAA